MRHDNCRWRSRYFQAMREERITAFALRWMSVAAGLLLLSANGLSFRIAGNGWEASLQIGNARQVAKE